MSELKDQQARNRIEKDALDCNMVVLAGAGAGKTHELVERMVNYVCTVSSQIDCVAAITFTRKAAGEMRGRFLLRLQERLAQAEGPEAERLQEALDRVDQCFIGTIHSFCGQLLRERPIEAGIRPDFTELDQREETRLSRQVWNEFVQQCFETDDPRPEVLEGLGLRSNDLHLFFNQRGQFSDLKLKDLPVEKPVLEGAVRDALRFMDEVAAHLPNPLPEGPDDFIEVFEKARRFVAHGKLESDQDQATFLNILHGLKKKEFVLKRWAPNQKFAKALKSELRDEFVERVTGPALTKWRQYVYAHVVPFINDAVAFYDQKRLATGSMTFQDLLLRAKDLLRDHPHVRRYFQSRYKSLFVDEFQDTDPIQAELLLYLTGEDTEEKNWLNLDPKPGSLFIVGDEKQSIYRFRRADVETFRLVGQRLEATEGRIEQLNTSFRSLGRLCGWVNDAFEPLFGGFEPQHQAEFAPMLQFKDDGQDTCCVRHISLDRVYRHSRNTIVEEESERIASFIAAALAGQTEFNQSGKGAILEERAKPGDFMILTQTRSKLPQYARALEARGIPYDVSGGGQLGDLSEIKAFVEMMEVVHQPDNPLPLLGYLRGVLVGMGDDELYEFRKAGGHFDYRRDDALPDGLSDATTARVAAAYERLHQAEERLQKHSPAVAFEETLEELVLPAFAVCEAMGSSRAGSLLRVLSLVRQWESQGWHWGQMVEELREVIDDPEYRVEEMTLESGQENVVKIMNVHQSKGLQARVVFLCDPFDPNVDKDRVSFHVSRMGSTPYLSLPVARPKGEYQTEVLAEPVGWDEDRQIELQFIRGENLRLVYVAATRAENLLVVSRYAVEEKKDVGSWHCLYPYLENVPELPHCDAMPQSNSSSMLPDWAEIERERSERWERVKKPSYTYKSAVQAMYDEDGLEPGQWGRGRDYGSLVHQLFEMAIQDFLPKDEQAYIEQQLVSVGQDKKWAPVAKKALDGFRASALWQEIKASDSVYTETPFALPAASGNGVERGIIDLVYRIPSGWKIVDYKTHARAGEDQVDELTNHFAIQVNTYAQHWQQIAGQHVVEKGLWFTASDCYVSL